MKNEQLIWESKEQKSKVEEAVNHLLPLLNHALNEWKQMGIGPVPNDQLYPFINDPEDFYTRRINELVPEETTEMAGPFKVKKASVIKSLELPDHSGYVRAADAIRRYLPHTVVNLGLFEITDSKIIISPEKKSALIESANVYAVSEEEQQLKQLLDKAIKSLLDLNAFTKKRLNTDIVRHDNFFNGRGMGTLIKTAHKEDGELTLTYNEQLFHQLKRS
ncbi:MAG TPA: hypothetical protein VF691_13390 [Cytophagaceae bacterium]|jgi:hypothetical protein